MTTRHPRFLQQFFLYVSAAILIGGCASTPKPLEPAQLDIAIQVTSRANPDVRGRPSPVVVRVYELRSTTGFEGADFFSLNDKDQAAIGADLVHRDEFFLQPGQAQSIRRKAQPHSRGLGVFVAYRDLERSKWRAIATIPSPIEGGKGVVHQKSMVVTIDEKAVSIQ